MLEVGIKKILRICRGKLIRKKYIKNKSDIVHIYKWLASQSKPDKSQIFVLSLYKKKEPSGLLSTGSDNDLETS